MPRINPNWIAAYLRFTSGSEAPEAFHLWTAIATLAGALQRKVYIDQKTFEWVPNFYIVLVGQAGLVTKSTSLRLGERLLRDVGKKIKFGSQSGSWQAMAEEIANSAQSTHFMKEGFTTCSVSYFVSEFGTFFDPTNREQIDFFVDSWDAQRTSFTRSTKSSGVLTIPCPCINILAATTPTWIKENFTATMVGGGFVSRLIFVRGHHKRKFIAYPALEVSDDIWKRLRDDLLVDLKHISNLEGPVTLTEDALAWGKNWYYDLYTKKRQLTGERFDGFYARKQTHMHKLATILSIAESDSLVVERKHLMTANEMLLHVERDLATILDDVTGKQLSTMHKREILSIISGEGEIDKDNLYGQVYQMMSGADFDKALSDLTKAHQLDLKARGAKTYLSVKNRPSATILPLKANGE